MVQKLLITIAVLTSACLTRPCHGKSQYCGIYSIYAAAKALGEEPDLNAFIDPKYISTVRGSTVADLKLTARDMGIYAIPLAGLGRRTLTETTSPLVLHVSPPGLINQHTHWLLFLGIDDGRCIIFDGPGGTVRCTVEEVLARWDGTALAVTKDENAKTRYRTHEVSMLLAGVSYGITLSFLAGLAVPRCLPTTSASRHIYASLAIFTLAIFASLTHDVDLGVDFEARRRVNLGIAAHLRAVDFKETNLNELAAITADPNVAMIDVRYARDFENGSIPGAQNLPIDSSLSSFKKFAKAVPSRTTLIVFCQSSSCSFSDSVAARLMWEGFDDVRIFRGGYDAWSRSANQ